MKMITLANVSFDSEHVQINCAICLIEIHFSVLKVLGTLSTFWGMATRLGRVGKRHVKKQQ